MATYYRWRKSEIEYVSTRSKISYDTKVCNTGLRGQIIAPGTISVLGNKFSVALYRAKKLTYSDTDGYYGDDDGFVISSGGLSTGYNTVDEYYVGHIVMESTSQDYWTASDDLYKYTVSPNAGTSKGYVYSTSSSAYPNGGVQDGYYYDQRTTVTSPTAPTGLTYPNPITTPMVTVNWQVATSNTDYPVTGYNLYYGKNGDESTTNIVYPQNNPNTSAEVQIPSDATSIRFWVGARDSNGSVTVSEFGPWVSVYLAPTLTVPQMVMQAQQATINWTSIEGADSYTLQRKSSADSDWVQMYSGANLTFSETVGTWTTVQYRVQAVFDGTPGGWAESAAIPVVSASSLVISGTDEDLGTVTNDIPYSISTDTGNQITATITVNNAVIFSGNVGNSTADVIPVLDLITGEGTIVISATVEASGSPVTATRTWTYEKAAITFPNSGSVAQVTKEGENIYPKVLAEGVRLPGGKTLDQVMGFPCQIYTGSYVGTGTSGAGNPNTLTFPFEPKVVYIYGQGAGINLIGSWGWTRGVQEGIVLVQNELMKPGITISWADKSVSWYQSGTAEEAAYQMNSPGITYLYVALG